jgi:pantoate kinase
MSRKRNIRIVANVPLGSCFGASCLGAIGSLAAGLYTFLLSKHP